MEILEYGNKENKKIILIHGFQSPYQIWDEYIEHYKNKFHIIVPILPGHNENQKEEFVSFKQCAKEIENYYISRYGNNVHAIFCMSMGGLIAANIWQNSKLNIKNLIFDGSPLVSYPKMLKSYFIKFYLNVTHKTKQRDAKTIKQAVGSIITEDKLDEFIQVLDNMSDNTIINYITEWGKYRLPIVKSDSNIYYFHGTKMNEMLSKKTVKCISKNYPNSNITCFKGKGHCENSIMNPKVMIKELDKILEQ